MLSKIWDLVSGADLTTRIIIVSYTLSDCSPGYDTLLNFYLLYIYIYIYKKMRLIACSKSSLTCSLSIQCFCY
jgi:hypothetical protein